MPPRVAPPERSSSPASTASTPAKPIPIARNAPAGGRSRRLSRARSAIRIGEVKDKASVTASGSTDSA